MAGIKHEEKIQFSEGHIYVLMNDEWSVDISGEQGLDGDLVGMCSWDFKTREAWEKWGSHVIERIQGWKRDNVSPESLTTNIYDLDYEMPADIRLHLN